MSTYEQKIIDYLKRTKVPSEDHRTVRRDKVRRKTPSPFSKRQAKCQQDNKNSKEPAEQQPAKNYFIPISQKMRSKVSHINLYKSYEQNVMALDGKQINQQDKDLIFNEINSRNNQTKNQIEFKQQIITSLEGKRQSNDHSRYAMQSKLYQIPLKGAKLTDKLNKNVISFLKIPNINPNDTTHNKNFHSLYQMEDYVSKLSHSPKKQKVSVQNESEIDQSSSQNKKCSIIPALHLSTHYKLKRSKDKQKKVMNFQSLYDYALIKKVRREIQNCLVVESKQQKLLINYRTTNKPFKTTNNDKDPLQKSKKKIQSILVVNNQTQQPTKLGGNEHATSDRTAENISQLTLSQKPRAGSNIAFCLGNTLQKGVYQKKMSSYRQFLFMVNFAHRIFDPLIILDPVVLSKTQKYAIKKYYYYVGLGNNSMLVRSLMNRRIWWEEVKNPADAHFVWTQIKIEQFIENQPQYVEQGPNENIQKNEQQSIERNDNTDNLDKSLPKPKKQQYLSIQKLATSDRIQAKNAIQNKSNKTKSLMPKGLMYRAPFSCKDQQKILTKNDSVVYRTTLTSAYNSGYQNLEQRIKNLPNGYLKPRNPQTTRVNNHFECNHSLGNKKALLHHLLFYYKITNQSHDKAFPKTYHIKQSENDPQFKLFLDQYRRIQTSNGNFKNIWILKPGENSNRGKGITVVRDLREIRQQIRPKGKHRNGETFTYILQKYIQRPLLYKGRKFDIRHYMVITRLYGKFRAYWFGEGYVRTSSSYFQLDNIKDPMIHLTNDAIQKNSDDYGYFQQGNKVSYNQLQKYFSKYQPYRQFQFNKIYQQMRNLCLDAVKSTFISLDPRKRLHNFQVFGLDFMIDQQLKVYLIEINTNPCLQLSSNLLARVIPSMLQQSFRLSIDPLFPPNIHYTNNTRYLAPDCSIEKFQFELIFDESKDGAVLTKLYEQNMEGYQQMLGNLVGSEKEQDDVFDNEGEEIEIDNLL